MKIGIIGTGNISYRHFEEFSKINDVNIEAVCDVNDENLQKFISHFGGNIKSYSSAEEMLEKEKEFDGISNTTPDRFHKDISLKSLAVSSRTLACSTPLAGYAKGRLLIEVRKCGENSM